jgi:hypothetical protein
VKPLKGKSSSKKKGFIMNEVTEIELSEISKREEEDPN